MDVDHRKGMGNRCMYHLFNTLLDVEVAYSEGGELINILNIILGPDYMRPVGNQTGTTSDRSAYYCLFLIT